MKESEDKICERILKKLPYSKGFLFVDEISYIDENKVTGHYTFKEDEFFYKSHFSHTPETPGVILIEAMGQIGMVCHLIFLEKLYENDSPFRPVLSNVESSFFKPVKINDRLTVTAEKLYYRNGVLKSDLQLFDSSGEVCVICKVQIKLINDLP